MGGNLYILWQDWGLDEGTLWMSPCFRGVYSHKRLGLIIYLWSMDETMCSIHGGKYRIGEVCIECVKTVYKYRVQHVC